MISVAARRYAQALFELAREKNLTAEATADWTKVREAFAADHGIAKKLADPKAAVAEKKALVSKGLGSKKSLVLNTVHLLIDRHRETEILSTALAFFELVEKEAGVLRVGIESAHALSGESLERIVQGLSKATGKKVTADVKVNADLLGGLRITVDSRLIDGSVKKRLEVLSQKLKAAV